MSEARVEQQRPASGAALLVLVGLGIAFALLVALLAVAKSHSGPIYGEANMLYTALVLYAGAATLYMGYGVTGIVRYVNAASLLTAVGFVANTAAVAHRWSIAGRPPFSNMYEMLLELRLDPRPADPDRRESLQGEDHRIDHHADHRGLRDPDAVVAKRCPAPGSGPAVHLVAGACDPGHALLRGLRRQLCPRDDVPDPGQHEDRILPGTHFGRNDCGLRSMSRDPFPLGRTRRDRLRSGSTRPR